jgi:hypothetical protein
MKSSRSHPLVTACLHCWTSSSLHVTPVLICKAFTSYFCYLSLLIHQVSAPYPLAWRALRGFPRAFDIDSLTLLQTVLYQPPRRSCQPRKPRSFCRPSRSYALSLSATPTIQLIHKSFRRFNKPQFTVPASRLDR